MAGIDAFGTQFARSDMAETDPVFETIANVTDISGPSREREQIEVTAHDSPDKYREFVKGLKDGGSVELTLNYDPDSSTQQLLDDDFEEDSLRDYRVVILPGTAEEYTWEFSALITALGDEFPHDDKAERSVTVKITGKPDLSLTGV
ncbi:hypothetical protein H0B56_12085 [Haloechinothrix sp. YIM 98757]|uniref:Lambda phage tail tube protein N-terminal domain-containing protein n=1 Tax=Haloechinothrix aidingensis TaxID=2752311 RepID=A0A838AAL8_9PSEU|nr:phage tail tube protein [Haloechinothrix aidingensis]MBA0126281.1 hypothetical protein [Haloechinothrix aidingensis]